MGGRGLGSKEQFGLLFELADLLEGEVGATRPAVLAGWTQEERLLGQTKSRQAEDSHLNRYLRCLTVYGRYPWGGDHYRH